MSRIALAGTAAVVAAVLLLPGTAEASWTASGTGTAKIGALTMRNVSGFTAACTTPIGNKTGITLSWTPSPDTFVASYTIVRLRNNVVDATFTNIPRTTSTYDEAFAGLATTKGDIFSYTIRAIDQNWTTSTLSATGTPGYVSNKNQCA